MPTPPTYLALDQGGHASRALVFDSSGSLLASAAVPVDTRHPAPDQVEQDPEQLVASLHTATAQALAQLPAGWLPVAAGLATQRSSLVCWERSTGRALSPVLSWQDRRNARWLEGLAAEAGTIRRLTGLVLSPHYGASKLRWCLDHVPAVQEAARWGALAMGPLASYLACRLLQERPMVADPANAARTQLWNPATRQWEPALLELFRIPAGVLPRCVESRHTYGRLPTPRGRIPLTVLTGDQSAVPFAFGELDPATAYINIGTGAFVQRAVQDRLPAAPRLLVSVVWSETSRVDYMLEGTVNGAGSALNWLAESEGRPVAELLVAAEAAARSGAEPPLFLNGIGGLGAPYWVSDFPSRFVGSGDKGLRALAVLESIAFLLVQNLKLMQAESPPLRRILLSGGLAQQAWLAQALADLAELPVLCADDPEATARGLARLVAGITENWPAVTGTALEPRANGVLPARFRRWCREMATLTDGPGPDGRRA